MLPKNHRENDDSCFLAWYQCLAFYSQSSLLQHLFPKEIKCFIECVFECVNAGIANQKYILTTVLQENIQKETFEQIANIYLFIYSFL